MRRASTQMMEEMSEWNRWIGHASRSESRAPAAEASHSMYRNYSRWRGSPAAEDPRSGGWRGGAAWARRAYYTLCTCTKFLRKINTHLREPPAPRLEPPRGSRRNPKNSRRQSSPPKAPTEPPSAPHDGKEAVAPPNPPKEKKGSRAAQEPKKCHRTC